MAITRPSNVKNPILVEGRRAALVAAAIKVFMARGYHDSKVSDVAREARISQGTVYNYIRSKEDILYLVCSEVYRIFDEAVREALKGVTRPLDKLDRAIHASVDATLRYQNHLLLLYQEVHCLDRKARRPFLRDAAGLRAIFQDIIDEVAAERPLAVGNSLIAATLVLNAPSVLIMRRWDLRGVTLAEMHETLVSFVRRGLGLPDRPAG